MNKKILLTSIITGALAFGSHLQAQDTASTLPFVTIFASDPTALEGTSTAAFTLIRSGDTTSNLVVNLNISGSASNGVDYTTISNVITIPSNYLAVDILVQPILDTVNRGNKTVNLGIQTNANYQIGGDHRASVTIIDDVFNIGAPTVTISAPTNDSMIALPATITLTADVADPGATIKSVSFLAGDELIGRATNTSSPYTISWTPTKAGRYSLFARAVNSVDESTLSQVVNVTLTDVLPVVEITSPTNGANFSAHQDIPISATVTDADASATITNVSFFANGRHLGSTTNSPYSITWSNAPSGFYTLQAKATDNSGQNGYSKRVVINISRGAN